MATATQAFPERTYTMTQKDRVTRLERIIAGLYRHEKFGEDIDEADARRRLMRDIWQELNPDKKP